MNKFKAFFRGMWFGGELANTSSTGSMLFLDNYTGAELDGESDDSFETHPAVKAELIVFLFECSHIVFRFARRGNVKSDTARDASYLVLCTHGSGKALLGARSVDVTRSELQTGYHFGYILPIYADVYSE